jgi:hypothetical protein
MGISLDGGGGGGDDGAAEDGSALETDGCGVGVGGGGGGEGGATDAEGRLSRCAGTERVKTPIESKL